MTRSELCELPSAVLRTDWTRAEIAALFSRLGLKAMAGEEPMRACAKLEAAE